MSTPFQAILEDAIESLVAEGKEPTTALIKARLSQPVPMPVLLSALQSWKKTRKVPNYKQVEKTITLEERVAELEAQVNILTERLNSLS